MRTRLRGYDLGIFLVMATLLAGCGGDSGHGNGPQTFSPVGVWDGTMLTPPPQNGLRSLTLTLQEAGTDITGTAQISDATGTPYWDGSVTGSQSKAGLFLTATSVGAGSFNLDGQFKDSDAITATLNGGGWINTPVTLTRR